MKPKLILCLALVLSGCHRTFDQHGRYKGYWLNNGMLGEYVNLVLARKPLAELSRQTSSTNESILDCEAIIVTTYARDSIWNTDRKPFKCLTGVESVGTDFIVIKGKRFDCTPANLDDVLRLLHDTRGKVQIHRMYGPTAGQEEPIRRLTFRLEQQLSGGKMVEPDPKQIALTNALDFICTNDLNVSQYEMTEPEAVQRVSIAADDAWRVSWRHKSPPGTPAIKGGQLVIIIYDSGRIEKGFGE